MSLVLVLAALGAARSEELSVGTYAEFPPFETLDESGEVRGFDIDVINAIGRVVVVRAGDPVVTTRWVLRKRRRTG